MIHDRSFGSSDKKLDFHEEYRPKFLRDSNFVSFQGVVAPLPLYKSCMSVAIPRPAANYMLTSRKVHQLLRYLNATWVPDESFWATLAGSPAREIFFLIQLLLKIAFFQL